MSARAVPKYRQNRTYLYGSEEVLLERLVKPKLWEDPDDPEWEIHLEGEDRRVKESDLRLIGSPTARPKSALPVIDPASLRDRIAPLIPPAAAPGPVLIVDMPPPPLHPTLLRRAPTPVMVVGLLAERAPSVLKKRPDRIVVTTYEGRGTKFTA